MGMISREQLLAATEVPTETVSIPELGGDVVVRGMTSFERATFETRQLAERRGKRGVSMENYRERLIIQCCVQPTLTASDLDRLKLVRGDIIGAIADPIMRLSGLSDKEADELGPTSENPAAFSTSAADSPSNSA